MAATSFRDLVAHAGPSLRASDSDTDQFCMDWTRRNHLNSDSRILCRFSSRITRACLPEGAACGHDKFKGLSSFSSSPTFTSASSQFSELLSQTVPFHPYPKAVSSRFGFSQSLPPAAVKAKRRGCTTRAIALGDAMEDGKAEGDNTEGFSSISDFTRLSSEGKRVELQTATVTYRKRASWWDVLTPDVQVRNSLLYSCRTEPQMQKLRSLVNATETRCLCPRVYPCHMQQSQRQGQSRCSQSPEKAPVLFWEMRMP